MEQMKKHRLHILLPILLVVLALAGSLIWNGRSSGSSAQEHVSLGQQYLNKLDYSAAVLEFSNAVALDPTDRAARIGLAQAYSQTGNHAFAAEVLEDVLEEDALDPEIAGQLIQIYEGAGEYEVALRLIGELVRQTDEGSYYEQQKQAIALLHDAPHAYAVGTDQVLALNGDGVRSRGSNTLGQLGTARNLGQRNAEQEYFSDAGFAGQAKSVYCAGRTSYIIDENRDLWAAGENRWGQMGLSYGTALPESGWKRLTDTGDVAAVAGGSGTLMVLKTDGSLWLCGGGIGQTLERSTRFSTVIRISSGQGCNYVLTGMGDLYQQYQSDTALTWNRVATDVVQFSANGNRLLWVDSQGNLYSNYGFSCPPEWEWQDNGSVRLPFVLRGLASNGNRILFWTAEGVLYQMDGYGTVAAVFTEHPVTALFSEAGSAVAVLEDGSLLLWEAGAEQYTVL